MKKKCQGTYNYAFSNLYATALTDMGFQFEEGPETDTYGVKNFWIYANSRPFCIQTRELHDEHEVSKSESGLNSLIPGFLSTEELNPPKIINSLKLCSILTPQNTTQNDILNQWHLPVELSSGAKLPTKWVQQLRYKKLFPFWGLILETPLMQPPSKSLLIQDKEFPRYSWLNLETISWDLFFFHK